jgi:hypothetical protein
MGPWLPLILFLIPPAKGKNNERIESSDLNNFGTKKGYTYFVKTRGDTEGFCVTNETESAVAVLPQRGDFFILMVTY